MAAGAAFGQRRVLRYWYCVPRDVRTSRSRRPRSTSFSTLYELCNNANDAMTHARCNTPDVTRHASLHETPHLAMGTCPPLGAARQCLRPDRRSYSHESRLILDSSASAARSASGTPHGRTSNRKNRAHNMRWAAREAKTRAIPRRSEEEHHNSRCDSTRCGLMLMRAAHVSASSAARSRCRARLSCGSGPR